MNTQQNVGYGFVPCAFDDPKRSHFYECAEWKTKAECKVVGQCRVCAAADWRKPVEIPEGWELVPAGTPQTSDMKWWNHSRPGWDPVVSGVGVSVDDYDFIPAFIRRKPAVIEDGWLDASTVKPSLGQRVWFVRNERVHLCPVFDCDMTGWTHWKPAGYEVPKPPQVATKRGTFAIRDSNGDVLMRGTCSIKPEPKLRPWKIHEVPKTAILRRIGGRLSFVTILNLSDDGITFVSVWDYVRNSATEAHLQTLSFDGLLDYMEHSLDGGKTWLPCGVME